MVGPLGNGKFQWGKTISSEGDLIACGKIIYGPDLARTDDVIGNIPVLSVGVERHAQVNLDADLNRILRGVRETEDIRANIRVRTF